MTRMGDWSPFALPDELADVVLNPAAMLDLIDRVTKAIRKARTAESVARAIYRIIISVSKKAAAGGYG